MKYIILLIFFLLGASVGSFINVVLDRYNTGLKFWQGKSFCFSCNKLIRRIDMFPVLSFLLLHGRCRNCGSKIPQQSFIIEFITGILFVIPIFKFNLLNSDFSWMSAINYLILVLIFAIIVLISFYDLRHMIIPDSFLLTFLLLSFLYNSLSAFYDSYFITIFQNVISGIVIAFPFFILFLLSKGRWIGFGDIKYIFVIGFFLGFINGSSAVIIAFWIGAVFSVFLLLIPRCLNILGLSKTQDSFKMNSAIPFGPFLSLGLIISLCLNVDILQVSLIKDLIYAIL